LTLLKKKQHELKLRQKLHPNRRKVFIGGAIVLVVIVIIGGLFYWYEWRPVTAKDECNKDAYEKSREQADTLDRQLDVYNFVYNMCMRNKGL